MADANTAIVVLASVQGALTLALVGATAYYAWRTHDISKATREQANASVEMAREMREQRLSQGEPKVFVKLEATAPGSLLYIEGQTPKEVLESFPDQIDFTVTNYGPGVALDLDAIVHFKDGTSFRDVRDVLMPQDAWRCTLGRGLLIPGPGSQEVLSALGLNAVSADVLVSVQYNDVHSRTRASYMCINLGSEPTGSSDQPDEWCLWAEQGARDVVEVPHGWRRP